jgi:ferredoxin
LRTNIYYFSGTGNSLFIAKKIKKRIENCDLISIPSVIDKKTFTEEVVGIVCPIYMYNAPYIVVDFLSKIKKAEYIFFVFAGAGDLGTAVKSLTNTFNSNRLNLSALFSIPMPSNYTPFGATPDEKQKELFGRIDTAVDDIVKNIQDRKNFIAKSNTPFFNSYIHPGLFYKLGYKYIRQMAKSFYIDNNCNGCSICQKVCPVKNINMKDKKPVWNDKCQQCYACLQWCPNESIQYGKKTAGIKRYHNPYIKVLEIINSSVPE